MQSRVGLWGGSCAIRLPKMAVESLGFREGETISLHIENGALVVRPAKARFVLANLVDEAKTLTPPQALDDEPMGDELL